MDFTACVRWTRDTLARNHLGPIGNKLPWAWLCKEIAHLLQSYGSGLTRTILLAEIESSFRESGPFSTAGATASAPSGGQGGYALIESMKSGDPTWHLLFNLIVSDTFLWTSGKIYKYLICMAFASVFVPIRGWELKDGAVSSSATSGHTVSHSADFRARMLADTRFTPMQDATEFSSFFRRPRRILATHLELPPHNDVSTMGLMQKRTLKSPIYPSSCVVLVLDHPCTTVLATGNRNQTSTFATHSQQNNKYDDSELIRSIFGVEFDAQSKTFVRCKDPGKPVFDVQQHWFKVQHIEGPIYSHRDQKRKSSIHGTLVPVFGAPRPRPHPPQPQEDQSSSELPGDSRVRLDFYLEDADIARLVHKGNNLGVLCPIVHKPPENTNGGGTEQRHTATVLEYGSQSILFAVQTSDDTDDAEEEESSSDCGKANLSQLPAKKHHDGFFHFDKHVECPDLDAITPNIKHICLYGTVVLVSGNAPVETNGRVGDRYGLRIRNDKGQEADITLWDELGLAVAKMLPGQKVLIGNLVSELYKNKCFISGGLDKGTYIYNISTFTSIISSPDLRDIHYISTLSPNGATSSYCVKAVVVDVVVNTHPSHYNDAEAACLVRDRRDLVGATYLIHNTCKHPVKLDVGNWKEYVTTSQRLKGPVDSFPFQCLSCRLEKIPGHDVVASYSLRFKIDDGSSHIVVESSTDSSMEIIGIPPSLFLSSAALDSQLDALYRVVGCEFLFGLESLSNIVKATNKSSKSKIDYRIDTALQASNPSSGIVRLLPGSPKK